jgi:iron complex transport system substrate-binding protein
VRRQLVLLCAAAALAAAGCEATDTDDAPETSRSLKIQHALGETKVPGQAERPVTLYPSELDDAFALDAAPVGTAGAIPGYLGRARTHDVEQVGTVARPDLGRIATLDPDVILAGKRQKGYYERLRDIAPTVALDEKVDWKANLRQDGEALGRPEFAERLLTRYDREAARVKRLVDERGKPPLPVEVRDSLSRPFVASVLDDVGVSHPKPRSDTLPGARPGRSDAWTLGMGYIAAMRILDDVERFTRP